MHFSSENPSTSTEIGTVILFRITSFNEILAAQESNFRTEARKELLRAATKCRCCVHTPIGARKCPIEEIYYVEHE